MGVVSLAVSASRSIKDVVFHVCNVALHILHLDGILALGHSPGRDMAKLSAAASEIEYEDEYQVIWAEAITPESEEAEDDAAPLEEKPSTREEVDAVSSQGEALTSDEIAASMHTDSIVSPKVFQSDATTIPPEDASLPAKAMSAKPITSGDEAALSSILEEDASILSNPTEETEESRLKSLDSVEEEAYEAPEEQEPQPEERQAVEITNNSRSLMKKPPATSAMDFVSKQQRTNNWSGDEEEDLTLIHEMQQTAYRAPSFMPTISTVIMSPRVSAMPSPSSSPALFSRMPSLLSPRPELTPKRHKIFHKKR